MLNRSTSSLNSESVLRATKFVIYSIVITVETSMTGMYLGDTVLEGDH